MECDADAAGVCVWAGRVFRLDFPMTRALAEMRFPMTHTCRYALPYGRPGLQRRDVVNRRQRLQYGANLLG